MYSIYSQLLSGSGGGVMDYYKTQTPATGAQILPVHHHAFNHHLDLVPARPREHLFKFEIITTIPYVNKYSI